MTQTFKQGLLASTLFVGAAIIAAPAYAQDQDQTEPGTAQVPVESGVEAPQAADVQEIVVTGSRIARPDLEASSPVTVVSGEALEISGTVSVEDYLREIPQVVAAIGGATNNGNPGVATIDLRNLGEERTLVLVDGKRFVPYDSNGIVDLNMIPAALVERVEVLTGGASSVYGSDAIAGVVNFIMKDDFEGIEADAQAGITQRGDGFENAFSLTMGVNSGDGRGNLVANATYVKTRPVTQGQRAYSRNVLASADLGGGGNSFTNAFGTVDGLVSATCASQQGTCVFDETGNLVPYDDRFGFNFNPFNLLQAPQEKWTATVLGRYDITDSIEFFGRASFANSRVTTVVAPSGTFFFPFDINYATNPNLSDQARAVLAENDTALAGDPNPGDGIVSVAFGRRTVELGTRDSIYENTAYQLVGGLRGDIVEGLRWEAFAQWGRTSRTQTFANDISFSRTQAGILDGSVNLFGQGNLTQEAGNAIRLDLQQYDTTSQTVLGGFLAYDLPFALGGTKTGGLVGGVEYRREGSKANPDENLIQGNAPGFGSSTPIDAEIEVKEIYGEVKIPILDIASIEGGIRYSDYQNRDNLTGQGNSFKTTSYKFGGDIEPIPGIRARAMYQRAVRAPNLNEIGQPLTPSTGDLTVDPCQSTQLTPADYAANGPLAQLCRATGVPAAAAAAGIVGGPVSGQINNYLGGNINLTPEKSRTITAGVVIQPDFLRGFTASVDYFDIEVENAIVQLPEEEIVNLCYNVEQDPDGVFCSRIQRNPLNGSLRGGTETGVDARNVNAGFLRTEGIDITAAYRFDLAPDVRLALAANATYTMKSWLQSTSLSPVRECEGLVGKTCLRPLPKWQWVQTSTLTWGPATVQLRWRHIGKITNDTVGFGTAAPGDFAVPTIGSRNYFDLFTSYDVGDHFTFRFGVNNLLDKLPPVVGNDYGGTTENSGNTFPATYDPLGRSFFAGVNVRF
ncbi:TonB-dependent receptor domain-containing protein [Sphingosinicella rhizophila]|uniref:TonB-dependent receptor n=1 Tax=Sphingosinicella rhizophila TaxID=3050082 RepID=A0ABU3QD75_9SPHN|nr:TonB-dependent receptor [Sphingosinicella sp. GR2756]MDT9600943.1 TonB-dependent receptor [Sphingosinicella sp. GR2756]